MKRKMLFLLLLMMAFITTGREAISGEADGRARLRVGTREAPPFSWKDQDGQWTGISICLWREIAEKLHLAYEYREEEDLEGLVEGLASGSLDLVAADLAITREREEKMDLSYPFQTTGLAIAAPAKNHSPWAATARTFLSLAFLKFIIFLVVLLFLVGGAVWLLERRKNPEHFGGPPLHGLGAALWWCWVTMTTVGYGDKVPKTVAGRVVSGVWMFTALILVASFTAAVTSTLTVSHLSAPVVGPGDLYHVRTGAVEGSSGAKYLHRHGIAFQSFPRARDGLAALSENRIDAFVCEALLLKYWVRRLYPDSLRVVPGTFHRQDFGFAFPQGSPLRDPVNMVIMEVIHGPDWEAQIRQELEVDF